MYSQKKTSSYTGVYWDMIRQLKQEIEQADAIVIGAGSGLSTADGFLYSGQQFQNDFADFIAKYGYSDMYSAGFYPYASLKEFWAYWSHQIYLNRYGRKPGQVYTNLLELIQNRDYFVLTTNVDHCFQRAGFDKKRLFYTQGDYGLWQCSKPCHPKTYDNEETVLRMVTEQIDMQVPHELIPHCPVCGRPMTNNLRCDGSFVEDTGWKNAAKRYEEFLNTHRNKRILYWELGVGENTPVIIKYPFWRMTHENPNAVYASINQTGAAAPEEIQQRSICLTEDISAVLYSLIDRKPPQR